MLGVVYFILPFGAVVPGHRFRPLWPLGVAAAYVAVFSMLAHKEFRFVFPVLYLALPFAGSILHHWHQHCRRGRGHWRRVAAVAISTLVLINLPVRG